jgi:hypothetical protein
MADIIRGASGARRGDDLLGIDPLQVDRGRAEVGVTELTLDHVQWRPSRASSTACAWRS